MLRAEQARPAAQCGRAITRGTQTPSYDPSLTQGGPGLVTTVSTDSTWNGIIETRSVSLANYTHPWSPFPPVPPICSAILQ